MKNSLFFLLLFLFLWLSSFGQTRIFEFYLVDENTGEGIPFLSVIDPIDKQAFQSDYTGLVTISTTKSTPVFRTHHLSYASQVLVLSEIQDTVRLQLETYILPEFQTQKLSAQSVVQAAIYSLSSWFPPSPYYLEGNYIQIHQENEKYVRYIEAKVEVEKSGYSKNTRLVQEEKFAIQAIRKSYVYEQNGEQHGDHLSDLFADNPIQYLDESFLNEKNLNLYNWQFSNELYLDVYAIEFQNLPWSNDKNIVGVIFIDPIGYKILGMNYLELPNIQARAKKSNNWKFVNGWNEITFDLVNDLYVVSEMTKGYHHQVYSDSNPHLIQYEVAEEFIWKTTNTQLKKPENLSFKTFSNLYNSSTKYTPEDWNSNEYLDKVRSDLEQKFSLEYQFMNP